MSKKKNTLLRNTSILMAATIISRVIGLLYRSPLGETIGNEGLVITVQRAICIRSCC